MEAGFRKVRSGSFRLAGPNLLYEHDDQDEYYYKLYINDCKLQYNYYYY